MKYRHCKLQKNNIFQYSYIPETFAHLNQVLKLKEEEWENGWKVIEIGSLIDESELPDWRKEIRGHRKTTGDSLPKENK